MRGGPDSLIAMLEGKRDIARDRAIEIVEKTVVDAATAQADILENALTPTGIERVASGRGQFAGRHVTGEMIGSIDHDIEIRDTSDGFEVEGRYGFSDPEEYVLIQDGIGPTQADYAARSLAESFVAAREQFRAQVEGARRGRSA